MSGRRSQQQQPAAATSQQQPPATANVVRECDSPGYVPMETVTMFGCLEIPFLAWLGVFGPYQYICTIVESRIKCYLSLEKA